MEMLRQLFGSSEGISWGQEMARAALVFLYGLAAIRLAGRRLFGKWAALDIVVSIIVGSNLSRTLTGNAPLLGTLLATTLLLAVHWLLSHAVARWVWASILVEGRPCELASNARQTPDAAHRWLFSKADLDEAVRQAGLSDISDARQIVLEPSGKISVLWRTGAG